MVCTVLSRDCLYNGGSGAVISYGYESPTTFVTILQQERIGIQERLYFGGLSAVCSQYCTTRQLQRLRSKKEDKMKRLMLVTVASLLLMSVGFAAEEEKSEDTTGYKEYVFDASSKKCEDVTGYGEYVLGTSSAEYDFTMFVSETDYLHKVKTDLFWDDEYKFAISGGSTTTTLYVTFRKDELQNITILFEDLMIDLGDSDDVIIFVKDLRITLLEKYDYNMVILDYFGFEYGLGSDNYLEGFLTIQDEEGDRIMLNWDGYDLTLAYFTEEMWDSVSEFIDETVAEGEDKL